MSDLDTHFLRPGAFARTPFGTPFFVLFTHPELDITGLCKRRLSRRMRAEMEAWEKLQCASKLFGNESYVDVLREDHVAAPEEAWMANTPAIERTVDAGLAVEGASDPDYGVLDTDRSADELGVDETTVPSTDDDAGRDADVITNPGTVHEIAGFVVIDMAKPTESAFLNHKVSTLRIVPNMSRTHYDACCQVEPAEGVPSLLSHFLNLLLPVSTMNW